MITLLLTISTARALDLSELRIGGSVGLEEVVNDPFLNRRGLRFGGSLAPVPWIEGGSSLIWFPVLGQEGNPNDPDWKPLVSQLLENSSVSPDISKITFSWQNVFRIRAIEADLDENWSAGAGLEAGFHLTHTKDDAVALSVDADDPEYAATASEWHGGPLGGVFLQVGTERVRLRFRVERVQYIETVKSTTLEMKGNNVLGGEVMLWLP